MADETMTEGKSPKEQSTPKDSQPLTADALTTLQSQWEERTKQMIQEAESRWQSDKDRRIPKIEQEQSNLRKTIEEVLNQGGNKSVDEIERTIKLNRLLDVVDDKGNLPNLKLDMPKVEQSSEAQRIAKELNLDLNDKDIAEAVKSGNTANLFRVALSKVSAPSADETTAPLLQGQNKPPAGIAELTKKYQTDMANAPRGKSGDSTRRILKENARKAGVPVDSIGFV